MATVYSDDTNADETEVDNATDMTCATQNRTIPFGTRIKVTVTDTGASAEATVHDRGGPALVGVRIIDCRPALADALGIGSRGVVPVRLELVSALEPTAPAAKEPDMATTLPATAPSPSPEMVDFFRNFDAFVKQQRAHAQAAAPPHPPPLSPIDKAIGGQALVGKKTISGVVGLLVTWFGANYAGVDVSSTPAVEGALGVFALLTSAGFLAKLDRGIQVAQKVLAALQQIATAQQQQQNPPAPPQ
jgi:3D (Asp-Asp-Asp) domain-containing protein